MDVLLERIIQNQILLEEASGKFQGVAAKNTISLPIKLFLFLEHLKQLAIKFREFLLEVKKLNL